MTCIKLLSFCKVHNFADDANLLHFYKSIAKLNKLVNQDMRSLTVWLNANRISLNVEKIKLEIEIKVNKKRLYLSQSVKYLGIKINQNLSWKDYINDIAVKLNRANALLFKIRNLANITILKTMYFAIFDSQINCAILEDHESY